MPVERIVATAIILLIALVDYLGFMKPVKEKPVKEKEETAMVEVSSRSADITVPENLGEHNMAEVISIPVEIKNTGRGMYTFVVNVEISGPGAQQALPFKRISLEPGESKETLFEYKVPLDASEGRYTVSAVVWDRLQEERPVQKISEAKSAFRLIDALPEITFLDLGLSAQVGERLNLKVRVRDDRGVKWVRITYQFPGMSQKKTAMMQRKSGNERDGIWAFTTDPSRQTGQFIFRIEAMDTKLQIATTEEYRIAIVTKM